MKSVDPYHCEICGQLIMYHEGVQKIMNMANGFGGKKGTEHKHKKEVTGITCNRCDNKYNPEKHYQCQVCFKQCCQLCGYLYTWSQSQNTCKRCKSMYSKTITLTVLDRNTGKYVKKDSMFINYEIYQVLEEHEEIISQFRNS